MRRPHLFLPPDGFGAPTVAIEGPAFHHIAHVLRIQPGEEIVLLDGLGNAFEARITAVEKRRALAEVSGAAEIAPEPMLHVTVAQAIGKGDKLEQVIQHGTELGASAFIPLITERTVRRPEAKLDRWQQIARSAAEQCGRGRIPQVQPLETIDCLIARLSGFGTCLMLDPHGEPMASSPIPSVSSVLLMVGPEGGFSECEVDAAHSADAEVVSLGPYVLRTETAALAALSLILLKIL